jgi:hypothetical protein
VLEEQRTGKVTEIEYRTDGLSQWTTVGATRYLTRWLYEEIDWKLGDTVTFEAYKDDRRGNWRAMNIRRIQ